MQCWTIVIVYHWCNRGSQNGRGLSLTHSGPISCWHLSFVGLLPHFLHVCRMWVFMCCLCWFNFFHKIRLSEHSTTAGTKTSCACMINRIVACMHAICCCCCCWHDKSMLIFTGLMVLLHFALRTYRTNQFVTAFYSRGSALLSCNNRFATIEYGRYWSSFNIRLLWSLCVMWSMYFTFNTRVQSIHFKLHPECDIPDEGICIFICYTFCSVHNIRTNKYSLHDMSARQTFQTQTHMHI